MGRLVRGETKEGGSFDGTTEAEEAKKWAGDPAVGWVGLIERIESRLEEAPE